MILTTGHGRRTGHLMRFHRAHFHGVLLSHLPSTCTTHNAKRLKSYSQPTECSKNSPITLTFTDGSTATCDVLIGADGIKSAVRSSMFCELAESVESGEKEFVLSCINPIWSGVNAYRTLVSAEKLRAHHPDHPILREHTQVSLSQLHVISLTGWHLYYSTWARML
jgi:salicylate hydroxylase